MAPTVAATASVAAAAGLCEGLCRRGAARPGGTGGNWGLARAEEPRPSLNKESAEPRDPGGFGGPGRDGCALWIPEGGPAELRSPSHGSAPRTSGPGPLGGFPEAAPAGLQEGIFRVLGCESQWEDVDPC